MTTLNQSLRELLDRAIETMTVLHAAAQPDDDSPDMDAIIPSVAFGTFVDEHARLLYDRAHLPGKRENTAEPYRIQFPTLLRKMWSDSEIRKWLDELPPLYAASSNAGNVPLSVCSETIRDAILRGDALAIGIAFGLASLANRKELPHVPAAAMQGDRA